MLPNWRLSSLPEFNSFRKTKCGSQRAAFFVWFGKMVASDGLYREIDHHQARHDDEAEKRNFEQTVETITHFFTLHVSVHKKREKGIAVPRQDGEY